MASSTSAFSEGTASAGSPSPSPAIEPPLRGHERVAFGLGDVASNLSWNMVSSFLLFYYTDVAGIAAAAAGTLILAARFVDAGADVAIGVLVDRTRSRHGKARPYLLWGAVPFGIVNVATFTVPDASHTVKVAYACTTFLLLGLLFSALNIPYGSLMPMMTRDQGERATLGGFRAMGSSVGTLVVTSLTTPLVVAIGGSETSRTGYFWTTVLMSAVSVTLFLVTFRHCRERHTDIGTRSITLGRELKAAVRNGPWRVANAFAVVNFVRLSVMTTVTIYYCLQVLHRPWAISLLLPLVSGSLIVGGLLTKPYYARLGRRRGNVVALAASAALFGLLPLLEHTLPVFVAVYCLACLCSGVSMTSLYTAVADTVDYNEWRFGVRSEGLLNAGFSLATKVGTAIGGAFVAFALARAGYTDGHNPPDTAISMIKVLYYGAPPVLMLVQIGIIAFWRLDAAHPRIVLELAERHRARS
ncbi:glycoside-pentoside-hexuronide (GPH):cation symporter [Streptomyces mexicanus]|uniref:MFS transporter n=1 Tax=Streptomyces mexicanus TaxID=178566 RepID=UPI0031E7B45E